MLFFVLPGGWNASPEAEAAGITKKDFKTAIERLLQRGVIEMGCDPRPCIPVPVPVGSPTHGSARAAKVCLQF
jgi:hypothetical protein